MPKTDVAVTLDPELAAALDRFVASRRRDDRTEAMEAALAEKVLRRARTLLAGECAEVDPLAVLSSAPGAGVVRDRPATPPSIPPADVAQR